MLQSKSNYNVISQQQKIHKKVSSLIYQNFSEIKSYYNITKKKTQLQDPINYNNDI